jgi:uncharacterized protein (DUF58 family)
VAASTHPSVDHSAAVSLLGVLERRAGITLSGLAALALAVVAWLVGNHFGGRALYLAAYCAVAMVAAAAFLARRRRPITAVRSAVAQRARVGQVLDVALTLTARSRVTTFRVEEELDAQLGPPLSVPVPVIAAGEEVTHGYTIRPRLRGVYRIGPLTAEFSDPMGLAKRRQLLLPAAEIIVHPNTEGVLDRPLTRAFEDPPLRPPRSRPWPEGFEFYGMRDYVAGDDLRRVVWRAYARTDKLLVREFEQGISDRVSLVLDTDESWHSAGAVSETFEAAVSVIASVGVRHIKEGMSVRLVANQGRIGSIYRGPKARLPFLDAMAAVQRSREPLSKGLEVLAKSGRIDDHIVLVTSHFDSRSAALGNVMVNAGASITLCSLTWDEADPMTLRRAHEIGAQVVPVRPGASLSGVFRASMQHRQRAGRS